MPSATATVTKTTASQVAAIVAQLANTQAAINFLAGASPSVILTYGPGTAVGCTPSPTAIAAITADLQAQAAALTTQLAGFGVTN